MGTQCQPKRKRMNFIPFVLWNYSNYLPNVDLTLLKKDFQKTTNKKNFRTNIYIGIKLRKFYRKEKEIQINCVNKTRYKKYRLISRPVTLEC